MPYFPPYIHQEYPKWLRRPGQPDVLVEDADEEAARIAAWGPVKDQIAGVTENKLMAPPAIDHVGTTLTAEAKRKGGWPKGKKRGTPAATVN